MLRKPNVKRDSRAPAGLGGRSALLGLCGNLALCASGHAEPLVVFIPSDFPSTCGVYLNDETPFCDRRVRDGSGADFCATDVLRLHFLAADLGVSKCVDANDIGEVLPNSDAELVFLVDDANMSPELAAYFTPVLKQVDGGTLIRETRGRFRNENGALVRDTWVFGENRCPNDISEYCDDPIKPMLLSGGASTRGDPQAGDAQSGGRDGTGGASGPSPSSGDGRVSVQNDWVMILRELRYETGAIAEPCLHDVQFDTCIAELVGFRDGVWTSIRADSPEQVAGIRSEVERGTGGLPTQSQIVFGFDSGLDWWVSQIDPEIRARVTSQLYEPQALTYTTEDGAAYTATTTYHDHLLTALDGFVGRRILELITTRCDPDQRCANELAVCAEERGNVLRPNCAGIADRAIGAGRTACARFDFIMQRLYPFDGRVAAGYAATAPSLWSACGQSRAFQ